MKTCLAANTTPITPANDAPHAKARSLVRTSGTPIACAASSSSRIASQARPMCESSSRRLTRITTPTMSEHEEVERLGVGQAERHRRPADGGDALGAVREVDRLVEVVGQHADHLAEAEGDDGQVVAVQPQHRQAEQHAGDGRGQRVRRRGRRRTSRAPAGSRRRRSGWRGASRRSPRSTRRPRRRRRSRDRAVRPGRPRCSVRAPAPRRCRPGWRPPGSSRCSRPDDRHQHQQADTEQAGPQPVGMRAT